MLEVSSDSGRGRSCALGLPLSAVKFAAVREHAEKTVQRAQRAAELGARYLDQKTWPTGVAEAREEDFAGEEAKAEGAEDSQDTRKDLPDYVIGRI